MRWPLAGGACSLPTENWSNRRGARPRAHCPAAEGAGVAWTGQTSREKWRPPPRVLAPQPPTHRPGTDGALPSTRSGTRPPLCLLASWDRAVVPPALWLRTMNPFQRRWFLERGQSSQAHPPPAGRASRRYRRAAVSLDRDSDQRLRERMYPLECGLHRPTHGASACPQRIGLPRAWPLWRRSHACASPGRGGPDRVQVPVVGYWFRSLHPPSGWLSLAVE